MERRLHFVSDHVEWSPDEGRRDLLYEVTYRVNQYCDDLVISLNRLLHTEDRDRVEVDIRLKVLCQIKQESEL